MELMLVNKQWRLNHGLTKITLALCSQVKCDNIIIFTLLILMLQKGVWTSMFTNIVAYFIPRPMNPKNCNQQLVHQLLLYYVIHYQYYKAMNNKFDQIYAGIENK